MERFLDKTHKNFDLLWSGGPQNASFPETVLKDSYVVFVGAEDLRKLYVEVRRLTLFF